MQNNSSEHHPPKKGSFLDNWKFKIMNDEQVHIKICEPNFEVALAKHNGPLRDPVSMNSGSMIIKYTNSSRQKKEKRLPFNT